MISWLFYLCRKIFSSTFEMSHIPIELSSQSVYDYLVEFENRGNFTFTAIFRRWNSKMGKQRDGFNNSESTLVPCEGQRGSRSEEGEGAPLSSFVTRVRGYPSVHVNSWIIIVCKYDAIINERLAGPRTRNLNCTD